jgi:hypothetical protein
MEYSFAPVMFDELSCRHPLADEVGTPAPNTRAAHPARVAFTERQTTQSDVARNRYRNPANLQSFRRPNAIQAAVRRRTYGRESAAGAGRECNSNPVSSTRAAFFRLKMNSGASATPIMVTGMICCV